MCIRDREYVAENGIMSGVSAREFAPNAGFSRAMLAQTLYAMSGKPAVKVESTFADVAANAWYADAVNWAAEKGYVSGVGDGKFAPDASVTREQMALILYRYAGSPDASGMAQKDVYKRQESGRPPLPPAAGKPAPAGSG